MRQRKTAGAPGAPARVRERLRSALNPDCGWPEQFRRIRRRVGCAAIVLLAASVPLVLFALAGLPHAFREPLVRNVLADMDGDGLPAVDSPRFPVALRMLTGGSLSAGHRVELLVDDDIFPRLWADVDAARRSITLQIYYARSGKVADRLHELLVARARAGVHVYFLYDAVGSKDLPDSYFDSLRAAGVRTAKFRPLRWYALDRANHRSHVRGVVIDGSIAYTGGFGVDDKWLGSAQRPRAWRETDARFTGPAVLQLQAAFVAQWAEATGELLVGGHLFPPLVGAIAVAGETADATLLFSPPVTGSTTAERLLALSIASARRRLYITNAYFVPRADYVQLLSAAARRGVDVRLLTNGPRGDNRIVWLAGRARYEALLAAGVRIFEYQPTTIHAKTFVVDGEWSGVGTMNFDNRSLAYNSEVTLVTRDDGIGRTLEGLFLSDLRFAEEIRLEPFRRRPWTSRLLESGASRLAGLL